MKRDTKAGKPSRESHGPSQRQLRAGELVRHSLAEILREEDIHDEALQGAPVTVTEVRMSPDLRHATCFVEPLGGGDAKTVVAALNKHSKFLRGQLGRAVELKFTPELRFVHDKSFNEAARMAALFNRPEIRRDLVADDDAEDGPAQDDRTEA
jgi:ribosome-binding factor A